VTRIFATGAVISLIYFGFSGREEIGFSQQPRGKAVSTFTHAALATLALRHCLTPGQLL